MKPLRWLPLAGLMLASLACSTLQTLIELPGPEDLATDAVGPTATPRPPTPTRTPGPTPTPQPTLAPSLAVPLQTLLPLRPEFAADAQLFPNATRYTIDVTVRFNADGTASLAGRELIRYTNPLAEPLAEIYLMLWPNDPHQYLSDMTLENVLVAGQPQAFVLEHDGLAARLNLAAPLPPGQSVELSAEFNVEAYPGIEDEAARFGLTTGVLLAPTFYPLIPRLIDGQWQTLPAPEGGDTTNSDTAFYEWRITAPADLAIVATGRVIETSASSDTQTQTLLTGPVRDLALAVGPLELTQQEVDGITLNAYVLRRHASQAATLLKYAAAQVAHLNEVVGPYPYTELDFVDAPGAFGGIEYPALILVGVMGEGDFLERVTVHEVGHQWFYGLIGDDQLLEPWLDEAAASYTEVLYAESAHGARAAQRAVQEFEDYLNYTSQPEAPIGWPVGDYAASDDYGIIVYGKGALFFHALRQTLGDETFFNFLRAYYTQYRYGFADAAGFQAVAEQTCACSLNDLFDLWVYKGGELPR